MANPDQTQYNFEVETIIKQFVSLLTGAVVMRYDFDEKTGERTLVHTITPQYVCGPKQRVVYDLVNKAKNYILPCVAISLTGITLQPERFAAKLTTRTRFSEDILFSYKFPTPVKLTFSVSIITKLITDLYQIFAKLCTQFQQARVFSWYVPHDNIDPSEYEELTSKVTWNGDFGLDMKLERRENEEDKFIGKMTFDVEGWIFPNMLSCRGNIILDIGTTNYVPDWLYSSILDVASDRPLVSDVMKDKNFDKYDNPREWANIHPRIVNIFQTYLIKRNSVYFLLDKKRVKPYNHLSQLQFTIDGYNLDRAEALFVPKDFHSVTTDLEKITYDYSTMNIFPYRGGLKRKKDVITGYKLQPIVQTENMLTVSMKKINYLGNFDIVVANSFDYDSFEDKLGTGLYIETF